MYSVHVNQGYLSEWGITSSYDIQEWWHDLKEKSACSIKWCEKSKILDGSVYLQLHVSTYPERITILQLNALRYMYMCHKRIKRDHGICLLHYTGYSIAYK